MGFRYNIPGFALRYPEYPEESEWNPGFWNRTEPLITTAIEYHAKLLNQIDAEYRNLGLSCDDAVTQFFGLIAGWAKRLKASDDFKGFFPDSEFLFVGNCSGDGRRATELVNGTIPSQIWSVALG